MFNNLHQLVNDDRAVSNTLGYVLLLSVVIISVSVTVAVGVPTIEQQQEAMYMQNTVRAFEVFSENIESLESDQAPARATEFRYNGGTMFQTESVIITVNISKPSGGLEKHVMSLTPVSYSKGTRSVHYETGSVIRVDADNPFMVKDPPFKFTDGKTTMSVIRSTVTQNSTALGVSGKVVILSRLKGANTQAIVKGSSSNQVEVNITVESPRYRAWGQYFSREGLTFEDIDHANNSVTYSIQTTEFYLRETQIRIDART